MSKTEINSIQEIEIAGGRQWVKCFFYHGAFKKNL